MRVNEINHSSGNSQAVICHEFSVMWHCSFVIGLGDFKLVLSSEPELGNWDIKVRRGDRSETASFTVDEYVLPKFEVTIKPPKYVTINTPIVSVEVCAR